MKCSILTTASTLTLIALLLTAGCNVQNGQSAKPPSPLSEHNLTAIGDAHQAIQKDVKQEISTILGDPGDVASKFTQNAPAFDNSTPDKTVESFWLLDNYIYHRNAKADTSDAQKALSDWYKQSFDKQAQAEYDLRKRYVESPMLKNYEIKHDDDTKPSTSEHDPSDPYTTYNGDYRKIQNVDMQTPTRAVVSVKVTNPKTIPPDIRSQMLDMDVKSHDDGITAQYILEKDKTGWKIMNISVFNNVTDQWDDKFGAAQDHYQPGLGLDYTPSESDLY